MSIFISYSSKHRDHTRMLAGLIEAQYGAGSVWWDHALESWGDYEVQIRNALNDARAVVVIWTKAAAESDWVKSEAGRANRDNKLVNVRPSDTLWSEIPSPYDQHHVVGLDEAEAILASIASVWAGRTVRTAVPLHEIYLRQHGHRLIDSKQGRLARDLREVSPTALLQAKFGIVGYIDASGTRSDLVAWCADHARPTAGRLLHGPGGVGKTRLMIEVGATMRERGWTAGFLDRPHEQLAATLKQRWQALDQLIAHGDDRGLLIVVDYAEGRQDEVKRLAERLSAGSGSDSRPVRLVLLARSAGEWWSTLHNESPEIQGVFGTRGGADVVSLPALSEGARRGELFQESLEVFAPLLIAQGYSPPAGDLPEVRRRRIESDPGYARPLAIQMEALLWLVAASPVDDVTGVDELLGRVLGLERSHWRKLIGTLDEERTRDMARGLAQVTAVQGVPSPGAAERLLMGDGFYAGQRTARVAVDPVVRSLRRVYGTPDGGIGQLEPDLIAEHHVATVGDAELIEGCLRWIEADSPELRGERRRDLLTVLQRATHPEHGTWATDQAVALLDSLIDKHAKPLARELVDVMVNTGGRLIERVERQVDTLDDESLSAIDAELPTLSLLLRDLALRVATRCAHLAREQLAGDRGAADPVADAREPGVSRLAARLGTLGNRLADVGRLEEALVATREAAELYRRLANAGRDAILPELASSLNDLSIRLYDLGRRDEALVASQEAVDLYRSLARTLPDDHEEHALRLGNLASSLGNLGVRLAALGQPEQALVAIQEAVGLYRRVADTVDVMSHLARSLNSLGDVLAALGRREEALAAGEEAVQIHHRLTTMRIDAFLPDFALSLSNLGIWLSALGRDEEALDATLMSVEIRRQLAAVLPDAFLPDLATSLSNAGIRLSALGRDEEALAATREAVHAFRVLARTRPDAFLPHLASSLNNLSGDLSRVGRREEALATSQEALGIRRDLARAQPDAFLRDLASSLTNVGRDLHALGRHEDALAASQEALHVLRRLADARPEVFLPDLARSLNNIGAIFANLGRQHEALVAGREAVEIRRRLALARPQVFLPGLASSLNNVAAILANLGRHQEALAATQEAADITRRLQAR